MIARAAALLVLAGCASGAAITGSAGDPISVDVVDVENPSMPVDDQGTRNYVIHVEVSNNSDVVQTVRRIIITPLGGDYPVMIDAATRQFDEVIDPGKDHEFPISVQGHPGRSVRAQGGNKVAFRVAVALANGDSYFYVFEGPVQ